MCVPSFATRHATLSFILVIVFLFCSAGAQWNHEAISTNNQGFLSPGFAVVDGNPAVVYENGIDITFTYTTVLYVRAVDAEGSSWSDPVILVNPDYTDYVAHSLTAAPSLLVVSDIPMFLYTDTSSSSNSHRSLYVVTSKDAHGTEWNDPLEIPNTLNIAGYSCAEVDGKLAIVFYFSDTTMWFQTTTTANASSWNDPVAISTIGSANLGSLTLAVVDGRPAVCYQQFVSLNKERLAFVIADDVNGTSWSEPVNIVYPPGLTAKERYGFLPSLAVIDGRPAVAYYDLDPSEELMFAIASTANGSSWNDPVTVVSGDSLRFTYISLANVNGYAAIAYNTKAYYSLQFVGASDVNASSWNEPVEISTGGARGATLVVVDGEPAIAYYGNNSVSSLYSEVLYARFQCTAGLENCNGEYRTCNTAELCVACSPECDLESTECVDSICECLSDNLRDCDEDGSSCEVNTLTDDENCGECGYACDTSTTSCVDGVCECLSSNLEDCDVDGHSCEANLLSDEQNCGECGRQCDSATTIGCENGICECAVGRSKENADEVSCSLVDGSPPCVAGYGADLDNNVCVDCSELLAYSPGGTVGCQTCDSECVQCDASSGECTGATVREWCLLQREGASMSECETCDAQFFATDALLSACSDQVRVSVDCGLVSESPQGILHTAFTLYLECNGVRSLMQDFAELLNVRLRQEDRKRVSATARSDTVSEPLLVWWSGSEWVPACTGCSAQCAQGYTCHQGEHAIHSTLQTSPPGNTPGTSPRPVPTPPGSRPAPVPSPSPSPSDPEDMSPRPADSASSLFLSSRCCLGALLLLALWLRP
eukprot:CAMPEP_0174238556 /NCGR_PEP_ID=MMETSP0417-20130205/11688_1 /TAXON_ID=242541 /ORGANISM="Mayorella sp, Strain BSH-02190019" /LENGTH=825 /DNA_ID=CAMNT_0015317405 /DNA_START=59 /DNA_END=2536 /DNA_ORIENTATION=+